MKSREFERLEDNLLANLDAYLNKQNPERSSYTYYAYSIVGFYTGVYPSDRKIVEVYKANLQKYIQDLAERFQPLESDDEELSPEKLLVKVFSDAKQTTLLLELRLLLARAIYDFKVARASESKLNYSEFEHKTVAKFEDVFVKSQGKTPVTDEMKLNAILQCIESHLSNSELREIIKKMER